jgi:hypothetical protein
VTFKKKNMQELLEGVYAKIDSFKNKENSV